MIVILIILCIGLGFYGGYRYGSFHIAKENDTLKNQLMLQERFSRTWAAEATEKYTLSQQVATQQVTNLSGTIQTLYLLNNLQQNQAQTLDKIEQEKIQRLIEQAHQVQATQT